MHFESTQAPFHANEEGGGHTKQGVKEVQNGAQRPPWPQSGSRRASDTCGRCSWRTIYYGSAGAGTVWRGNFPIFFKWCVQGM